MFCLHKYVSGICVLVLGVLELMISYLAMLSVLRRDRMVSSNDLPFIVSIFVESGNIKVSFVQLSFRGYSTVQRFEMSA